MVDKLKKPRRVMLLVKAGSAVDSFIDQLVPLLDAGHLADAMGGIDDVIVGLELVLLVGIGRDLLGRGGGGLGGGSLEGGHCVSCAHKTWGDPPVGCRRTRVVRFSERKRPYQKR